MCFVVKNACLIKFVSLSNINFELIERIMSDKTLELINSGVFEIKGASDYFFKFRKDYPTYDDIKKDYLESTNTEAQLKDLMF